MYYLNIHYFNFIIYIFEDLKGDQFIQIKEILTKFLSCKNYKLELCFSNKK
jgi:hypothetical protein